MFIVVSVENSILTQPWCSWDQADYQTPVSLPGGPCLYVTVTQITAAILIRHKVCEKQVVSPSGLMNRASFLSYPILHGDNLGVFIEEKLPQSSLLCITPLLRNSACYSASCVFFFYMNNFYFPSLNSFACIFIFSIPGSLCCILSFVRAAMALIWGWPRKQSGWWNTKRLNPSWLCALKNSSLPLVFPWKPLFPSI